MWDGAIPSPRAPRTQSVSEFNVETEHVNNWYYFWTLNFIVAGSVFCIIAIIVCIRGVKDLKRMFSRLGPQAPGGSPPTE